MPSHKPGKAPEAPHRPRVRRGNEEDAGRLRQDLLKAATELFAEGGLDAVSVRAVAARVGVSAMTPYRYFADKAELLSGLWQSVFETAHAQVAAAMAARSGSRGRLRAGIDAYIAYWEAHPGHYRLVYQIEGVTKGGRAALTAAPIYADLIGQGERAIRDLASEIGAGDAHVKHANDIRLLMTLGYMYVALGDRHLRYAWFDATQLRASYIEQIVITIERCLLHGPALPSDA